MIHKEVDIRVEGSLSDSRLYTYIIEHSEEIDIKKRPLILICPGGGYFTTCDREAEAFAIQFMAMGYHAAVLRYSTAPAVYPTALLEVGRSISYLKSKAKDWHIDKNQIFVQGCSAGGHLVASLGMFWHDRTLCHRLQVSAEDLKPAGMILSYPVITSGEYAHKESFENLLGDNFSDIVLREKMSLEKQVNKYTPKTFIWHTFTDELVPVENSLLLVTALKKQNIPTEFHMFPTGRHGLALATKETADPNGLGDEPQCASWISLVKVWLEAVTKPEC